MTTASGPGPDPGLTAIMSERRQLINLAYRLLGSLADAEDAVQETYARWYAMPPRQQDAIETPAAWLTTVASRICLDLLRSARHGGQRAVPAVAPRHEGLAEIGTEIGKKGHAHRAALPRLESGYTLRMVCRTCATATRAAPAQRAAEGLVNPKVKDRLSLNARVFHLGWHGKPFAVAAVLVGRSGTRQEEPCPPEGAMLVRRRCRRR